MSFSAIIGWVWDAPPPPRARLLLQDSLGCALAGLRHERVRALARGLAATMPGGVAWGLSAAGAGALLAAAMCWDEANDGLARAHGRPGLSAAPMALAALRGGAGLDAALAAYALGYEVSARAGEMWRIGPGLHVDGSWHSLGAAACAVRLAGGTRAEAAQAVAIAACQVPMSLYAPIAAGMDGRNSYPAHAVLLGHLAAASAMAGMTAPREAFDTARALLLPGAPEHCAPPGEWLMEQGYIKPWPGVRHAHYGVASALALRPALAGAPPTAVRLETYPEALRYAGNRAPGSLIAAQFSLSWAVAAALGRGCFSAAEMAAFDDPALRALEAMVELAEGSRQRHAVLTVETADGRFEHRTDAIADVGEAELRAKFPGLPPLPDAGGAAFSDGLTFF